MKAALTLIGIIAIVSASSIEYSWASTSLPFSLQWGSYGLQTTGQFAFPQGISVDSSGNVYVTDLGNRRIEKFDNNGNFLFTWGTKGSENGQFQAPMGIAIGSNAIYVVDNELSNVKKFDLTGKFVTQWGGQGNNNGQFLLPQGIAVDPSGDVYVVDTGNSRIEKFDSDGKFILSFGQSGLGDGQFLSPRAIAADSQGSIYVADSGNNRIEKFTQDGVFIQSYAASSGSNLKTPLGLTTDKSGNIYVVDNGNNRIVELDRNGNMLTSWGTQGKGPDFFDNPRDVVADAGGNVFVVDTDNNRIQKFGTQSIQTTQIQTQTPITNQTQTTQTQTVNPVQQTSVPTITNPNDKTPPSITAPSDMTVEAAGVLTSISIGQATATDDTGIASITNNSPQKFPLGTTMVTWTALDNGGNVAKTIQKITVVDTTTPVLTAPQPVTVEAKNPDHNVIDLGLPSVNDAVGVESVTNDAPPYFALGQTTVTWTARDASGNDATAKQIVTVKDTTSPIIHAPSDITEEATSAAGIVPLGNATVTDNGLIKSVTNNAPAVFPLGKTTVTWTATDEAGNTASSTQIITITDTTSPKITPPKNVVFEVTSTTDNVVPLGNATVTDNGLIKSVTNNAPAVFPLGKTTVTWTATDEAGNKANATQIVDVVDTTAPKITSPPKIEIEATSLNDSIIQLGTPTVTDLQQITVTNNAPKTFQLGMTTVTWTAMDASGNTANATQSVIVKDTTPPSILVPKDITIEATNLKDNVVNIEKANATDAVSVTSVISDAPSIFPIGKTAITWTATDEAGNKANATQIVDVVDTTAPKITPPKDIRAEATSLTDNTLELGNATATDIEPITIINNSTKAFPLGKTVVLWTATDEAGNKANATQIVDVVDTTAPKITPPKNIVVNATSSTSNRVDIGNATTSDDVKVVSVSNDAPAVFLFGNTTVTWTVKDGAGNTASVTQLIQVVDRTPPKLVMPSDIVVNATAFETPITIGQATASGIMDQSPKITNNATSLFHFGKTIIKWTAVDRFGNTNTLAQTITVLACGKSYSDYNLVMGTSGNDILTGSIVSNLIIGLEGDDIIRSGPAGDCIIAGNGDNIIFGGAGNDIIIAANGNNIIKGGTGNAQIYVGNGTNIIEGGSDRDTCYLGEPSKDTVVNCQSKRH